MNQPAPRDSLSRVLHAWRHEPAHAPRFGDEVWARIRSAQHATPAPRSTLLFFPRLDRALPLAASLAILLSIASGVAAALSVNRTRTIHTLASAYVRTIDPVQMTHGETNAPTSEPAGHDHTRSPS